MAGSSRFGSAHLGASRWERARSPKEAAPMSGELPQQREVGDAGAMRGRLKLRTPEGSESGSLSSLGGDDAGTSAAPCEDSEGGSVSSRGNDDVSPPPHAQSHDGCLAASDGMQQVRCALRLDVASAPGSSMATPSQWSAGGHVHTSARCSSGAVGVAEQPPEQGSQAGSPDVSVGTSVVVPCGQEPRPAKAIAEGPSAELEAERAAEGTESQRLQADQHLTTVKLRLLIRAQDAQLAKHREDLDRAERRAVYAEAKLSRMEAREAELLAKLEQQEAEKAVRLVRLQGEKLELEGRCARLQKALEAERELWESRDQEEIKTPREAPQRPDESRAFLKAAHTDLKTFLDQGPEKRRLSSTDVFER
ncbi:unnamed protein product [Prorocentrum cordatum]|uniref:Uncharacterized protein n=1 Tax=Prorocentrum cordatum TaxID=2364126 RepID=A0ABN9VXE1_9DINO|nr:unnamed protein product [Polarella glacialis]